MSEHADLPVFDDNGLNLADPSDVLGHKTNYISLLQTEALKRHVGGGTGLALDVGCGYGRMCDAVADLGFTVVGLDPSKRVLGAARRRRPQHLWCAAKMPELPFLDSSLDLVCLFNVARALHLLGMANICSSLARIVKPGGRLVVVDNLRSRDSRYLPEAWFTQTFERQGFRRVQKVAIRSSRWPIIYLIRYGLISERLFKLVARWELHRMARKNRVPRFSYFNYLFIYQKQ